MNDFCKMVCLNGSCNLQIVSDRYFQQQLPNHTTFICSYSKSDEMATNLPNADTRAEFKDKIGMKLNPIYYATYNRFKFRYKVLDKIPLQAQTSTFI